MEWPITLMLAKNEAKRVGRQRDFLTTFYIVIKLADPGKIL
jgi:hypothetical protein